MKTNLLRKIISIPLFLIPILVLAITIEPPSKWQTFQEAIEAIISFLFWVSVALVPIMIIIGGAYFVFSGGSPDKVRMAKNIILYTIIGFLIVLLAKAIVSVVKEIIGG